MNPDWPSKQSEIDILPFFSSFLTDILKITTELKTHIYGLIGIEPPRPARLQVASNVYSIMEACNRSYQDLRRAQTLLRGHLNGRLESERERDSARGSRLTARNSAFSASRNYQLDNIYQLKTFQITSPSAEFSVHNHQNATSRPENYQYQRVSLGVAQNPRNLREKEKTLMESKSQGHLTRIAEPAPPTETDSNRSQPLGKKNAVELINRIRQELGLGRHQ